MRILLILLLASCSHFRVSDEQLASLTPQECRSYGVNVQDDDQISGTIVHHEFGTLAKMERKCLDGHSHTIQIHGCAKAANVPMKIFPSITGEYEVYYSDALCISRHEACHALYELGDGYHTVAFNLRQMQGDSLAACP